MRHQRSVNVNRLPNRNEFPRLRAALDQGESVDYEVLHWHEDGSALRR